MPAAEKENQTPSTFRDRVSAVCNGTAVQFSTIVAGTWVRTSGEGHLYQARFKSFPVENDDHFLVLCRYAERNPLRAGLVARAEDSKYGSLWEWLNKPRERQLLAPWPIPRTANWVERVNQALTGKELAAMRTCVERGRPYGGDAWAQESGPTRRT